MVKSMITSIVNSYAAVSQLQGLNKNNRTAAACFNEAVQTKALTPEEEMAAFKKEFYAEISNIQIHSTVKNAAINISEAAFKRMKDDPQYKEDILRLIRRDLCAPFIHNVSSLITVGSSINEYNATAWSVTADNDFWARSRNSYFLKRTSEERGRKNDYARNLADVTAEKRLLEYRFEIERLEKEALEKKLQKAQYKGRGI